MFNTFTGCDVVLAFHSLGKKAVWQTWNVHNNASAIFVKLSQYRSIVDDNDLKILKKFLILMYDRSSTLEEVDDARLDMFARKQSVFIRIRPTGAASQPSLQHVKHAAYQAGCIWSQCIVKQPQVHSPAECGWKRKTIYGRSFTHCQQLPAVN